MTIRGAHEAYEMFENDKKKQFARSNGSWVLTSIWEPISVADQQTVFTFFLSEPFVNLTSHEEKGTF